MFNDRIHISDKDLKMISGIDYFNGQWPALKERMEHALISLRYIATIASIGSSTRIEGANLSDEDIDQFFNEIKQESFLSRDYQEVFGYKQLLETIFDSYTDITISENYIKQLHKILLQESEKDAFHLGEYKKHDNYVEARRSNKVLGVIFKTSSPFKTPLEMKQLVHWYHNESKELHALIKIALFIVHFLSIHPFQDGNGRLSRALTTLLLLKHGYSYVPYVSLESIIESNKSDYYKALRDTQITLDHHPNYRPWLDFFLKTLKKQTDILNEKEPRSRPILTKNQQRIIHFSESVRYVKNSDVCEALGMNTNTVKLNLKKLVDLNILHRYGIGKGTYYSLNIEGLSQNN